MASLTKLEGQSSVTQEKSNNNSFKACQIIDSTLLDARNENERWLELESKLEKVRIYENDDKQVQCIGANLSPSDKDKLADLIKQYKEIFTWSPTDMSGIDVEITYHKLSIDPNIKLVQQKKIHHGVKW